MGGSAEKTDSRISIKIEPGDNALVDIFSESGIGRARLEITSPVRPRRLTLRLHLQGLERLHVEYGETRIVASLSSTNRHEIRQTRRHPGTQSDDGDPVTSGHPDWMEMKPELKDGYIDVTAPESFLKGDFSSMSIEWVDFFR